MGAPPATLATAPANEAWFLLATATYNLLRITALDSTPASPRPTTQDA